MPTDIEIAYTWLHEQGFIIGARDPQRNTAFKGSFMVATPIDPSLLPTEAADVGGWCVVGDNLDDLIRRSFSFLYNGQWD